MEQVATLEIQNTTFRVTVGYLFNNKVDIIYRKVFPLTTPLHDCDIYDFDSLARDLSILQHLQENNLKISINEVVLIYPPYGLDVYTSTNSTNTISEDSRINALDIQNCLSLIRKQRIPNTNNALVDVVPTVFLIDNNRTFLEPPLNQYSSSITIKANMYTLPKKMMDDLKKALSMSKIKVKKEVIAPVGVSYLLTSLGYDHINYLLINFGERITTVSIVSDRMVVGSTYFPLGIDNLTDRISDSFHVTKEEAEALRDIYGFDERTTTYKPFIYTYKNKNSYSKGFTKEDLEGVIVPYLKEWIDYLKNAIKILLPSEEVLPKLGIVFSGEGTLIKGFLEYVSRFFVNNNDIRIVKTNSIGCENPKWANSVGAIYFSSIYKGSLADTDKNRISDVSRIDSASDTYNEIQDNL